MASIILGVTNVACGVVIILLSLPLLRGKVKRNIFYGMRIPQAFRSEEAWDTINRFGARRFIIWSIPLIILGVATFFMTLVSTWAILLVALAPTIVVVPALETGLFARRVDAAGRVSRTS